MIEHSVTGSPYVEILVRLSTWVLVGCALWAAAIAVAAGVEALTAGRVRALSWVGTPPALRRAILTALGLTLASGLPGPVSAAVVAGSVGAGPRPTPLPVPARPTGVPDRAPTGAAPVVVVRSGDTLWALAAKRLPRDADDARVLASVSAWHQRNRAVIGADPDLILPGQRLHPPVKEIR